MSITLQSKLSRRALCRYRTVRESRTAIALRDGLACGFSPYAVKDPARLPSTAPRDRLAHAASLGAAVEKFRAG